MAETDLELQLRVWKELAISKQILMRAATDALKLDPNCTQDELKVALDAAIKRAIEADVDISKAQEHAKVAISTMEKKMADMKRSLDAAEAARAEALAAHEKIQQQIIEIRSTTAEEVGKLKDRLADRERALKAVNTALADTPENVLKKMKALKKQKIDEANERKRAEDAVAALRKDKQKLEQDLKETQAAQEKAAQLAGLYRELHAQCTTLHEKLGDAEGVAAVPELDTALLESIEKTGAEEEKKPARKAKR